MSAIFIGFHAVQRLLRGAQTANVELGIGVSLVAMVLTVALIRYAASRFSAQGRSRSERMAHYASDLLLNGSVIVALGVEQFAGLTGADAVFGLLIGPGCCGERGARRATRSIS